MVDDLKVNLFTVQGIQPLEGMHFKTVLHTLLLQVVGLGSVKS